MQSENKVLRQLGSEVEDISKQHIRVFGKKSANLQQKSINMLCYSIIHVLQICCRLRVLWQIVAVLASVYIVLLMPKLKLGVVRCVFSHVIKQFLTREKFHCSIPR